MHRLLQVALVAAVAAAALARARRRAREAGRLDALRFAVLVLKRGGEEDAEGACCGAALLGRGGEADASAADLLAILELELPPAGAAPRGSVLPPGFTLVAQAHAHGAKSSAVLTVGARATLGLSVEATAPGEVLAVSRRWDHKLVIAQRVTVAGQSLVLLAANLDPGEEYKLEQVGELTAYLERGAGAGATLALLFGNLNSRIGGAGGAPLASPESESTISEPAEEGLVLALASPQGRLALLKGDSLLTGATPAHRALLAAFDGFVPAELLCQSLPGFKRTPGATPKDLRTLFFRMQGKKAATGGSFEQRYLKAGYLQLGWPDTAGWRVRRGAAMRALSYRALDLWRADHAPVLVTLLATLPSTTGGPS
jgi:hypothetical protein